VNEKDEQQGGANEVEKASSSSGMFQDIVWPELIEGCVLFVHHLYYNGANRTSAAAASKPADIYAGRMPALI
jgi:hypothetical protein